MFSDKAFTITLVLSAIVHGVILELLKKRDTLRLKIQIIPGITAACACASFLGAPLAQDFALISLSDLLIGRSEIEKKLKLAVKADFVIVLYNPKSNSRIKPLEMARKIIMQYRPSRTAVGDSEECLPGPARSKNNLP